MSNVSRRELIRKIKDLLKSNGTGARETARELSRAIEEAAPSTRKSRVRYEAIGAEKKAESVTPLQRRAWEWLRKHGKRTHAELAKGLGINGDVAYSLVSRLRKAGLLKSVEE